MLEITGYEKCQEAIALKDVIGEGILTLGKKLKDIRENRYYHPTHETFWQFCEEDMKMSDSKASRLISVYEFFILKHGISPTKVLELDSWDTAYKISLTAKSKDEAERLLDLVPSELKKEMAGLKNGEHKHEWVETHVRQCKICQLREKIYND